MRVAVDAYFNNNLGDDLFLDILINRYSNVHFDFMIRDYSSCKAFKNHDRVHFKSRKAVISNINNYDVYIMIGGSMFQEPKDWKRQWRKFDFTVKLFKFFGKKTFVLGCNFGPFYTEKYKQKYCKTFSNLYHLTVRDTYSYKLLQQSSINISLHPDIVFLKRNELKHRAKANILGISLIDLPNNKNRENYVSFISNLINYYKEKKDTIRLFGFQNTKEINDLSVMRDVMNILCQTTKDKIELYIYNGNISEFLEKYGECDSVITSRFHSLILSLIYEQKICPIVYSEKTKNTIKYLSLNKEYINLGDITNNSVKKAIQLLDEEKKYFEAEIIKLAKNAENHFSFLDLILKENK